MPPLTAEGECLKPMPQLDQTKLPLLDHFVHGRAPGQLQRLLAIGAPSTLEELSSCFALGTKVLLDYLCESYMSDGGTLRKPR